MSGNDVFGEFGSILREVRSNRGRTLSFEQARADPNMTEEAQHFATPTLGELRQEERALRSRLNAQTAGRGIHLSEDGACWDVTNTYLVQKKRHLPLRGGYLWQ